MEYDDGYEKAQRRLTERMHNATGLGTNGKIPGSAKTCTTAEFVTPTFMRSRSQRGPQAYGCGGLVRLLEEHSGAVSIQVMVEFYAATIESPQYRGGDFRFGDVDPIARIMPT
jgi:hypothetical protein